MGVPLIFITRDANFWNLRQNLRKNRFGLRIAKKVEDCNNIFLYIEIALKLRLLDPDDVITVISIANKSKTA